MRREWVLIGAFGLSGCWKVDPATLPVGRVAFTPFADPALTGWFVEEFDSSVQCPSGRPAPLFVIAPETPTGAMSAAVLLHSGAFDYVPDPPSSDPIGGPHHQDPPRLSRDWTVRKVFSTLGMYDGDDPAERPLGVLPARLAAENILMIIPGNCWGDWWHNKTGEAPNDITTDGFARNGRAMAEFAWKVASDPGFASAEGIEIPAAIDGNKLYAIGLGEGGRGVVELIASGVAVPTAVAVDSSTDDLRVFYAQPTLYANTITGLDRIFPGGEAETTEASFASIADLQPTIYIYSSLDSQIPSGAHDAALARLAAEPTEHFVYDAAVNQHVLTGADQGTTGLAVDFLLNEGPP